MYFLHKIIATGYRTLLPGGEGTDPMREELDLPDNFGHVLQKSVEELNNIDEIKRDGAIGFTLPHTPKNDQIFERFRSVAIIDNTYDAITVEVWAQHILLRFNRLRCLNADDPAAGYECEIFDGNDFWIEQAAKKKVRDLDLGEFTFTKDNCQDNYTNNSEWADGQPLHYLPFVDYGNAGGYLRFTSNDIEMNAAELDGQADIITVGEHGLPIQPFTQKAFIFILISGSPPRWSDDYNIVGGGSQNFVSGTSYLFSTYDGNRLISDQPILGTGDGEYYLIHHRWFVRDLRPLFSVPGLLIEGFKQIGWKLDGKILQHPDVRRWWDYILAPNYYATGGNEAFNYYLVERGTDIVYNETGIVFFEYDDVVQPNFGIEQQANLQYYRNNTPYNINAKINSRTILSHSDSGTWFFEVRLRVVEPTTPGTVLYERKVTVSIAAGQTETIDLELTAPMRPNDYILMSEIVFSGSALQHTLHTGSYIRVEPADEIKYIVKGSTHELALMVHPDYTLLDRFKGFLHLGDFKLKTDFLTKTVTIYPSENMDYEGSGLEGFWKPKTMPKDMTGFVVANSRIAAFPTEEQPRKIALKFQDAGDAYIETLTTETEETPYHGRVVDLGERFKGEMQSSENPFYEPTEEKQSAAVVTAAMWDNENHERSYDIGPRIVYAPGFYRQVLKEKFQNIFGTSSADSEIYEILYSFYYFEDEETDYDGEYGVYVPYVSQLPGTTLFDGSTPEFVPDKNIVYGTRHNDLFVEFWDRDRFFRLLLPRITFKCLHSLEMFDKEDFRQRWLVNYKGEPYIYRLIELLEQHTETDEPIDAVLIPEPNFTV